MRSAFLSALTVLIVGFASGLQAQDDDGDLYRLEIGDRIAVSVLEDPSLNQTVLVRPDGRITLPIAGTIAAAGRTPEALQDVIRRALGRDFLEPPTVTVAVVGLGAAVDAPTIYVLGEVGRPGPIQSELPLDLLQALSIAGGPGVFAATERIQVRRRVAGADQVILYNYDLVLDGAVPLNPVPLNDGDVIVVPQRRLFE